MCLKSHPFLIYLATTKIQPVGGEQIIPRYKNRRRGDQDGNNLQLRQEMERPVSKWSHILWRWYWIDSVCWPFCRGFRRQCYRHHDLLCRCITIYIDHCDCMDGVPAVLFHHVAGSCRWFGVHDEETGGYCKTPCSKGL